MCADMAGVKHLPSCSRRGRAAFFSVAASKGSVAKNDDAPQALCTPMAPAIDDSLLIARLVVCCAVIA